jgi:hypothetical protein
MRLRVFQPDPWKNARATDSNKRPPAFKMFLPSSLERIDQLLIQKTPLKITCKIDTYCDLLKTRSFLLIQIAQHRAAITIKTRFLCFFEKLLSQGPKRCCTLVGLLIPNAMATQPHTSQAIGQSKKRCWTVSYCAQKLHFVHPFHLRFTMLSLVSTTPFLRNQKKILIFRGNLAFQAQQLACAPHLKSCHYTSS